MLPLQPLRYKVAISFDSREYYENFRPQGILCHEALPIQRTSDADLLSSDADQTPSSPEGKLTPSFSILQGKKAQKCHEHVC